MWAFAIFLSNGGFHFTPCLEVPIDVTAEIFEPAKEDGFICRGAIFDQIITCRNKERVVKIIFWETKKVCESNFIDAEIKFSNIYRSANYQFNVEGK